jgi:hypothetical protein
MATDFPAVAVYQSNGVEPLVQEFAMLSTDTSIPGELVYFDTADNNVKECGADPANILGLVLGPGPASTRLQKPLPYNPNVQPVAVLTPDTVVAMCSATTPSLAHVARAYGVAKLSSGNWAVDTTDAVNTRVVVIRVDIPNGIFYVKFLAANLQLDAVAS